MYEHLDDGHQEAQSYTKMASYYSKNLPDMDSLAPWGRTNELIARRPFQDNATGFKTFYRTQTERKRHNPYSFDKKAVTQRVFTFRPGEREKIEQELKVREATRQEKRSSRDKSILKKLSINEYDLVKEIQLD